MITKRAFEERVDAFGMDFAFYRGLDPVLGRWYQVDPKAEAMMGMSPYCAMGNNPTVHTDPNGDILPAILIGMAVSAAIHTTTHLLRNDFSFNNWSWGAFAKAGIVGGISGAVAGVVGPALEAARIGGFYGGAILGASTGFAQSVGSGIMNNNLTLANVAMGTLLGAGMGGLMGGLDASARGYRFSDGRSSNLVERFQLADGSTPQSVDSPNKVSGEPSMTRSEAYESGEIGMINGKVVDRMGTANPNVQNINKGFEGELRLRGDVFVPEGREFYVKVDGRDVYKTTVRTKINKLIPSSGKNISWGFRGNAIQQNTILGDMNIGVTIRANSNLYITGNHRGWDGFLFWGR